jgi:hypothetical protein
MGSIGSIGFIGDMGFIPDIGSIGFIVDCLVKLRALTGRAANIGRPAIWNERFSRISGIARQSGSRDQ